jgi:hypothetical protein
MNTMTMRAFLQAVIANEITENVIAYAQNEIKKLDEKNDKKRKTKSKNQQANDEIKTVILDFMNENVTYTSPEITKYLNEYYETTEENTISTQKTSALMRQLVAEKSISIVENVKTSKGKVKGYIKNSAETETVEVEIDSEN